MEDNKIDGLDLPLEFLQLSDDPDNPSDARHDALLDESVTPIERVPVTTAQTMPSLDATGAMAPLQEVQAPERAAINTESETFAVYGLDLPKNEDSVGRRLSVSPLVIGGVAAVLALAIGGVVLVPRMLTARETQQLVPVQQQEQTTQPAVRKVEPGLSTVDVIKMAGALKYQKTDVSVAASRLNISLREGRVYLVQTVTDEELADPAALVTLTAQRSAALAAQLTDEHITREEGERGKLFTGLTWVVQASDKKAFMAVWENPGELRTADDPYALLAGAKGFVISKSLFDALTEAAPALTQSGGEAPTDLDEKAIAAEAVLPVIAEPEPEPEPEPEVVIEEDPTPMAGPEETAEETYEEEATYEEPVYEDTTYEETAYTEPEVVIEEETTPVAEPEAYVVPEEDTTEEPVYEEPEAYVVPDDEG